MEELFSNLEQIKENILNQKKGNNNVQSNYFKNNNIPNIDNIRNKRPSINYQKPLALSRPSMINIIKNVKSIDMSNKFYLIEESSDNEDGFNEDTKQIVPSLIKVAKNIFDPNLIMVLTDLKYFPKESQPGLIISGLEEWVTEKHLKYFLKGVPSFIDKNKFDKNNNNYNRKSDNSELDIHSIKFFIEQNKRYAYVKLKTYNQMEIIGNFFLNPIKKLYPSYNSKKEKIEIYFAYDLLKLTKNHWYGVILRNLPPNCNDKSIYNFTEQKVKNGIKYCLNPIIIDNMYCALVVCKELEYAEKLCHDLNNTEINNKYIKANLHPKICKIRSEYLYKNYENFSKEGYLFNINVEQSEKYLSFAKPFMEFFFPDYLNSFNNNNKSKKKEKEIKNTVDNNENNKKNKDNEKNIKREKDFILASSILDLFNQKSKNIEESKKNNNQNLNEKSLINNNDNKQNISKDKPDENQNKFSNENNIKNQTNSEHSPQINSDIIKTSEIKNNNENKNIIEDKKEKGLNQLNNTINNEAKEGSIIKYTQEEIKYYSYNMEDQKYYENLEIQAQRKSNSQIRRNNYYKDEYKSFNKSNYYNRVYKSQRYERNENNHSPHRQYNTSYKKHNRDYHFSNDDKEYNYNKNRERSKEKNINDNDEWKNFRENNEKNTNTDRRDREKGREYEKYRQEKRDRDIERDWEKNRERSRDKEWEEDRGRNKDRYRERDRDREKFFDERNKRYNSNRYYGRNNNFNERRKESWHSDSKQKNDRDKKDNFFKNKY